MKAAEDGNRARLARLDAPAVRTVLVAEPEGARYSRSIRVSGRTEPDKTSVLAARDSGMIRALPAIDGQYVSAGTVLLSLEGPEKLAAIDTAKALLAQRQAQSMAAESLLASAARAPRSLPTLPGRSWRQPRRSFARRRSAVEQLDVVAPFSGTIDDVEVERGSWVQEGAPVATILALNPIVVRGEVSERDLADVRIGTAATVNLANGASLEGRVRYVRRQASEQTRTFQVEVGDPQSRRRRARRDERRDRAARRPGRRRDGAALGGDDVRQRRARRARSSATTDTVCFVPVDGHRRHARRPGAERRAGGCRMSSSPARTRSRTARSVEPVDAASVDATDASACPAAPSRPRRAADGHRRHRDPQRAADASR